MHQLSTVKIIMFVVFGVILGAFGLHFLSTSFFQEKDQSGYLPLETQTITNSIQKIPEVAQENIDTLISQIQEFRQWNQSGSLLQFDFDKKTKTVWILEKEKSYNTESIFYKIYRARYQDGFFKKESDPYFSEEVKTTGYTTSVGLAGIDRDTIVLYFNYDGFGGECDNPWFVHGELYGIPIGISGTKVPQRSPYKLSEEKRKELQDSVAQQEPQCTDFYFNKKGI